MELVAVILLSIYEVARETGLLDKLKGVAGKTAEAVFEKAVQEKLIDKTPLKLKLS